MRIRSPWTAVVLAVAIAASSLAGCAHTYVDDNGSRHVIGLVWAKLPPPLGGTAADSLRVRAIGLSAATTPVGTALVLGYSDSNIVVVRENQLVDVATVLTDPR